MVESVRTEACAFGTLRSKQQGLRDSNQCGFFINSTFSPLFNVEVEVGSSDELQAN